MRYDRLSWHMSVNIVESIWHVLWLWVAAAGKRWEHEWELERETWYCLCFVNCGNCITQVQEQENRTVTLSSGAEHHPEHYSCGPDKCFIGMTSSSQTGEKIQRYSTFPREKCCSNSRETGWQRGGNAISLSYCLDLASADMKARQDNGRNNGSISRQYVQNTTLEEMKVHGNV